MNSWTCSAIAKVTGRSWGVQVLYAHSWNTFGREGEGEGGMGHVGIQGPSSLNDNKTVVGGVISFRPTLASVYAGRKGV